MRARSVFMVGSLAAAGLAAVRRLRTRQAPPAVDPAAELRRKLEESRGLAAEREEFEAAETPVDRAEPAVDERRRAVHEQARATVDELQNPPNG